MLYYRKLFALINLWQGVGPASRDLDSESPLLPKSLVVHDKRKTSTTTTFYRGHMESAEVPCLPGESNRHAPSIPVMKETLLSISIQIVLPFFLAGIGMVGAGILLDTVLMWPVFKEVPEILVLVPALLGVKGNLEMTLAARLSTEANLGHMDDAKERRRMIGANLILVQCQATVVGLLSSLVAVALSSRLRIDNINAQHVIMLCACSTLTASFASLVLGMVIAGVIVLSNQLHINPDNIATPLAAGLGDIMSLFLLASIAYLFHQTLVDMPFIPVAVVVGYLTVLPFLIWFSKKNKYTKPILYNGWLPIICGMLISSLAGLILDVTVKRHTNIAVFQPVINGVGGNLVSIQAGRLSTALHQQTQLGVLPDHFCICISPLEAFCSRCPHALTARLLLFLMIPGHIVFAYIINFLVFNGQFITVPFLVTYLLAGLFQVAILLYIAYIMTNCFWSFGFNPDNATIPFLTGLGDLLGVLFLGLTFEFLQRVDWL